MAETIYAVFKDRNGAERAAVALMAHGVQPSSISAVLSEVKEVPRGDPRAPDLESTQQVIVSGEAGHTWRFDPLGNDLRNSGEVQVLGGEIGPRSEASIPPHPEPLGPTIASLRRADVPEVGTVLGEGVLATALTGDGHKIPELLSVSGVPGDEIARIQTLIDNGGSLVAVEPASRWLRSELESVLTRYGAQSVAGYGYVA